MIDSTALPRRRLRRPLFVVPAIGLLAAVAGIAVAARGGIGGGGTQWEEGGDPADVERWLRDPSSRPKSLKAAPEHFYGLVPDGVARVEVPFSGGLKTASARVENNFFDAVSTEPGAGNRNGRERWFDADGKVIPH